MNVPMKRRSFLGGIGSAACAGALGLGWVAATTEQARAFERLDRRERERLADLAMDMARRAGAAYADLRICRNSWQEVTVRERRLDWSESGVLVGFGLRVLIDGAWGFAGSATVDEASLRAAVASASESAAAIRRLGAVPVVLETLQSHRDDWTMPMAEDPFAVALGDKVDLLTRVNDAALKGGASFISASADAAKEEKFFASSVGSLIEQRRVRVAPSFDVTVIDRASGRFGGRHSLAQPRAAGWEYVRGLNLVAEAEEAAQQAREKLAAKPVEPGRYDLVIDPTNLWLTLHESVGHSTELDRALGWEANYAGTSFVTPELRGRLQYGSALMTVLADRTQAGGLATVGYDDDGVKSDSASFAIIRNGIFENFQMAIGQAHLIGAERSNGCAFADGPTTFPLQRMPNISLQPNPDPTSLDDLIGGVENGILIVGSGSWSIDQQRYNFQFGGQLFYEIRNGKRGAMLRDVAYQAQSQSFWNAMDAVGDRSTWQLCGTFNCGKGEPGQAAPVSHGAPAARFRNINVLNTERGDL